MATRCWRSGGSRSLPTIVAIDNDPISLNVLRDLLEDEAYACVTQQGEAGAVAVVQHLQPALVILDLRLERPTSDLEILAALRAPSCTASIPVVLMTGATRFLAGEGAAVQAPGVAILSKSFDFYDRAALELGLTSEVGLMGGEVRPGHPGGSYRAPMPESDSPPPVHFPCHR